MSEQEEIDTAEDKNADEKRFEEQLAQQMYGLQQQETKKPSKKAKLSIKSLTADGSAKTS